MDLDDYAVSFFESTLSALLCRLYLGEMNTQLRTICERTSDGATATPLFIPAERETRAHD